MVMINEGTDRAGISNGGGGGDHQQQQQQLYDINFPPGYRFQPTDQELIEEYLYRKVNSLQLPSNRFVDVNIYSMDPWELAARFETYGERIHYFFTPREKRYPKGTRPNRAAGVGYWKACGADKPIRDEVTDKKIGYKRVLVFYRGKPPQGEKTNWIMHEYTLEKPKPGEGEKKKNDTTTTTTSKTSTGSSRKRKKACPYSGNPKDKQLDEFVLCKLYLKLGKSTTDINYSDHDDPCEDMNEENDIADDASPPPSIGTTTSSVAAAAVPENYHHMHQTAVVAAVNHQYPLTSVVAAATTAEEGMVPLNHHQCHMHQTAPLTSMVVAAAAVEGMVPMNQHQYHMDQTPVAGVVDHQFPLTSTMAAATPEEMMPFSNYSDNINPFSSEVALSEIILPSVPFQQWEEYDWNMFLAEMNNNDSHSSIHGSAGISIPDLRTDVSRK